jgi:alcohol dehydrogenase class IV
MTPVFGVTRHRDGQARKVTVTEAMGVRADGGGFDTAALAEAAVGRVEALVRDLKLPRRLREAGVAADDLHRLAQLALQSRAVQTNPRKVTVGEIEGC